MWLRGPMRAWRRAHQQPSPRPPQAGEIGVLISGGVTYVVAETNGVAGADLMIQIAGGTTFAAGDFNL
jgi:hypothetical protein